MARFRSIALGLTLPLAMFLAASAPAAAPPAPEITRPPDSSTPQPIGALHTVRNIPEACVRLEGLFTGDPKEPYRIEVLPRDPCVQRASYVDASQVKPAPSVADHWILNDRIVIARADAPACQATIEVWRHPGNNKPPALDAQGRARIYLDKPQAPVTVPEFSASVQTSKGC
ncbi:MAG: hypothetical protein JSR26_01245 [Proteobacteria bacterium]|nr:hypothetical protein [Pseudomonadota bacterium]